MKKCVVTCDHCGEQLDSHGWEELDLPFYIEGHGGTTDLCKDCQQKLEKLISDFVTEDRRITQSVANCIAENGGHKNGSK